jgi:hypothetical protein
MTKMSRQLGFKTWPGHAFGLSPPRLVAQDTNATRCPSPAREGLELAPLPCVPAWLSETRLVVPATRSRRKMSVVALVSLATRLVAVEAKAT